MFMPEHRDHGFGPKPLARRFSECVQRRAGRVGGSEITRQPGLIVKGSLGGMAAVRRKMAGTSFGFLGHIRSGVGMNKWAA